MKIYLASKSPRRRALLKQMQVTFDVLTIDIPESPAAHETPEMYSKRITLEKLKSAWSQVEKEHLRPYPVLCADTEVVLNQEILGKPKDENDAYKMLKTLSGRQHQVITSVGVKWFEHQQIALNTTTVSFTVIPESEIQKYLSMGDFKDKAGAYGIQGYIGQFIEKIEGCFYSVMGLPLNTVRALLTELPLDDQCVSNK